MKIFILAMFLLVAVVSHAVEQPTTVEIPECGVIIDLEEKLQILIDSICEHFDKKFDNWIVDHELLYQELKANITRVAFTSSASLVLSIPVVIGTGLILLLVLKYLVSIIF